MLIFNGMGSVKTIVLVCVLALPLAAAPVPNLRADSQSQLKQNSRANSDHLSRMADDKMVARFSRLKLIVPVPVKTSDYYLHSISKQGRYLRPWAKLLLDRLSQQYRSRFGKQMRVTSLMRTVSYQNSLRKRNGNAAPSTGPKASLHLTGACLDISKKGMTRSQQAWVRSVLASLHAKNYLFVIEEFQQPVFHIMVQRNYEDYVAQRLSAKK